jgi:hypothetical protein
LFQFLFLHKQLHVFQHQQPLVVKQFLLFQLLEIANGRFRLELHLCECWLLVVEVVAMQASPAFGGHKAVLAVR